MTEANPRIQARLTDDMAEWLDGRAARMNTGSRAEQASRSQQAISELILWRTVLDIELRRIRLTLAQASCIADVRNGFMLDAATLSSSLGLVYVDCYAAFRLAREAGGETRTYGAKHAPVDVDAAKWEQDLLDYLGRLSPAADHALRDAIARWWALPDDPELSNTDRFALVGLRVTQ